MAKNDDRIDLRVPEGTKQIWMAESERRGLDLSEAIRRAMPLWLEQVPPKRRRSLVP